MEITKAQLSTEEELFCIRYELETLSGIVNEGRLERWLPGYCASHTHKEHLARYEWVKDFVKDKAVLDVACGTGFGSFILATSGGAGSVTGWDIDEKTIRYAALQHDHPNLQFEIRNAELFGAERQFDVIVSFETIEHLENPAKFLANICQALADNGICFISTPISAIPENKHPDNIYHKTEWGFKKFQDLVAAHLNIDEIYLQVQKIQDPEPGFFSKVLQKAGLKQDEHTTSVEEFRPGKWDHQEPGEESIGIEWIGYQVLQCSKKSNAR